jgi:hypothetical protein
VGQKTQGSKVKGEQQMKIVFLFDQTDAEGKVVSTESIPFVTTPDKLNLRQLQPGVSSLGVIFDQKDDKGETQQYFRQIINFPINLMKVFSTLEDEIDALKQLLAERIGQQIAETAKVAKAPAEVPTELPSTMELPPAQPTNGAVATEVTKPVKKARAKKSA